MMIFKEYTLFIIVYPIETIGFCRISWILTALKRINTMFPWRTAGMPVPSFSSLVFCDQRMEDCLKTEPTKSAPMTKYTPWFSLVPLKSSNCLLRGLWRMLEWSSCMNHPQPWPPASTWQMSRIWWAEFLLSHCFWLVIRLQQSLTSSASARIQASRMAVPTLLQRTDGWAAMSRRSTSGCGSLGVASPAWEAWTSSRPQRGRMLRAMHGTSVQQRQFVIARRLQPDSKYTVLYDSMYEYVRVYTSIWAHVQTW